jgi:hypothetical protein
VRVVAELGDLSRFYHLRQRMGYLGLIPSEDSSGERRHQGAITKAGTLGWTSSNSLPATKEKALIAQGLIETLVETRRFETVYTFSSRISGRKPNSTPLCTPGCTPDDVQR